MIVLFLPILFIPILDAMTVGKCPGTNSMGTVLFSASDVSKQCWSPDEIALITARMILEDVLPDINVLFIDSNEFVTDLVEYFKMLINTVREKVQGRKKHILLLALTDLIGGYLQHAVLPIARNAFYAGLIDYTNMETLIQLSEEMKWFLRTNGQGWSKPLNENPEFGVDIIDVKAETPKSNNNKSCCLKLIYYEHDLTKKTCQKSGLPQVSVHFPLPFFDSAEMPTAIAVPFRKFSVRNIESRKASYVLVKFFLMASQCLVDRQANPESIKKFHDSYYTWIEYEVLPKLKDDKFYSAFGGVLRVYETLKSLGADKISLKNTASATQRCEEEGIISPEAKPSAKRSTAVVVIMILIIALWFIIGTTYICYRMRKTRAKWEKKSPGSTTSSGWSVLSKSSSKSESGKSCKCQSSDKSTDITTASYSSEYESKEAIKRKKSQSKPITVCYPPRKPPFNVESEDSPAILDAKQAIKMLPSIAEMSEHSSYTKEDTSLRHKSDHRSNVSFGEPLATSSMENMRGTTNKKKLSFSMDPDMKVIVKPCPQFVDKSKSRSFTDKLLGKSKKYEDCYCKDKDGNVSQSRGSSAGSRDSKDSRASKGSKHSKDSGNKTNEREETTDDTDVSAKSPRAFACHSSLTGDHNNEFQVSGDKPYVFGYDFQTSSSSDISDEEDMKTSSSKMSGK